MAPSPLLSRVRGSFRAVVRAVVPSAAELTAEAWQDVEAIVEHALADRPPRVGRQVVVFLRVLGAMARLRHGRPLERLPEHVAARFLGGIERSRLTLLRRGFWGVRTLAFMGYYGRPGAGAALGYRARAEGWNGRGATQGPWPSRSGRGAPEDGVMTAASTRADGDA